MLAQGFFGHDVPATSQISCHLKGNLHTCGTSDALVSVERKLPRIVMGLHTQID